MLLISVRVSSAEMHDCQYITEPGTNRSAEAQQFHG